MLASRLGRSRWVWIVGALALLVAIRFLLRGDDADDPTDAARRTATAGATTARDGSLAALDPALDPARRARTGAITPIDLTPGTLRLEGLAHDPDKQPLGGVRVTLGAGPHARVTTSEADGSFAFDDLAEGTYQLRAERDDFYGEDLKVDLTDASDPEELELRRGPTLDVLVVEVTGEPIANAHVSSNGRETTTDADGHATLRAVDASSDFLQVDAIGHAPESRFVHVSDDPSAPPPHEKVVLARGSLLVGTVVDEAGAPIADAVVELVQDTKDRRERLHTDDHGVWLLTDLATGTYELTAHSDVHVETAPLVITHDGTLAQSHVVVRVERGAEIRGIVVDARNQPVADARVVTEHARGVDTDAAGRFALPGLVAGEYHVTAHTDTDGAPSQLVTVTRGATPSLRIVVQPSSIAGVVIDPHGNPVEDVRVRAVSPDPNGRASDRTDEHGRFDLKGLPPGSYEVTTARDDEQDSTPAPGIQVATGRRDLRLVLPDLGTIRGRVVLAGKPVAYFGFILKDSDEKSYESPVSVRDADGRFKQSGLRAGPRVLVLVGPTFVTRTITGLQLASGKDLDLGNLVVEPGRTVHGRVTDPRGAPVPGARVSIRGTGRSADDDALDARASGQYLAHTDATGAYTITGIAASVPDADGALPAVVIDATTESGMTLERPLDEDETEVDLVVSGIGVIAGAIDPSAVEHGLLIAVPAGSDSPTFYANPEPSGAFKFDPLPEGDYTVTVMGPWTIAPRTATVVADQTTRLEYPAFAGAATVRAHWPECSVLTLRGMDSDDALATEPCEEGAVATFADVIAGSYRVCGLAPDPDAPAAQAPCKTIRVPATDEVTIEAP